MNTSLSVSKQHSQSSTQEQSRAFSLFSSVSTLLLWVLCLANVSYLAFYFPEIPQVYVGDFLKINGFTVLIWTIVTFFSALIATYENEYLKGFKYHLRFKLVSLGFMIMVMLFVMANHLVVLVFSWFAMGFFMAQLIGIKADWKEAKAASKYAQLHFFASAVCLAIGVFILANETGQYTLEGVLQQVATVSNIGLVFASLFIIIAAMIQSAIFPFHKWLLSAMTAPTPASALMHAGFVNGSGIVLTLFASILFASQTLNILFIIGGLTAIVAQFTKLLQVNVKQKLACSTIAQMGFMIMQCGLGFFNAALAHLLLHGFYKAYLFLSSGEQIANTQPKQPIQIKIKPMQTIAVLIFGGLGTLLFTTLTGKGAALDTGVFLTLIVAITIGQVTYNIVKEKSLTDVQKVIFPPVLFVLGITTYAVLYNGITWLLSDMPFIANPQPLTALHVVFGMVFLLGFFIMKLGVYQNIPWLYVKLLNASQPYKKTVLSHKS